MLTFRYRIFLGLVIYAICMLASVSVGIRWHVYRAHASKYARQEMQHTFDAAHYSRAAGNPGDSPDSPARAIGYRKLANMHIKAAAECAQLRAFYERSW